METSNLLLPYLLVNIFADCVLLAVFFCCLGWWRRHRLHIDSEEFYSKICGSASLDNLSDTEVRDALLALLTTGDKGVPRSFEDTLKSVSHRYGSDSPEFAAASAVLEAVKGEMRREDIL